MNNNENRELADLKARIQEIDEKVTQIHAFMFGVEEQGGLTRIVEHLDREVRMLSDFKSKVAGMSTLIAVLAGALGAKLSKFFFGTQ